MDGWSQILALANRERTLAAEGRWDELAASTAERVRIASTLGPPPAGARLSLEALAVVQQELLSTLEQARAQTTRELAGLNTGRGAVAGYAAAQGSSSRTWVNDQA
jgi:2-phospho-L-lactate transferase/gluconeogenesis factor (CofD/UPF0052 family)